MDLYAQNILDHYKNPRNYGILSDADISRAEANYACGDKLKIYLKFKKNKLADFRFEGSGCAISQAGISILGEQIIGKTKKEILALTLADMQKYLGVPISARRESCAKLGLLTIQRALQNKNTASI